VGSVGRGGDAISGSRLMWWDVAGCMTDPDAAGKSYTTSGGSCMTPGVFDSGFSGFLIAMAVAMDPQSRLLLETSWERWNGLGSTRLAAGRSLGVHRVGVITTRVRSRTEGWKGSSVQVRRAVSRGSGVVCVGGARPGVTWDTACSSSLWQCI